MLTEIGKNFYCSAGRYTGNGCKDNIQGIINRVYITCNVECPCRHRKYPTPEQFKEEYGEEPTKEMPVWVLVRCVWKVLDENRSVRPDVFEWSLEQLGNFEKNNEHWNIPYFNMNANFIDRYIEAVVIACTPFGKPPADWRP